MSLKIGSETWADGLHSSLGKVARGSMPLNKHQTNHGPHKDGLCSRPLVDPWKKEQYSQLCSLAQFLLPFPDDLATEFKLSLEWLVV